MSWQPGHRKITLEAYYGSHCNSNTGDRSKGIARSWSYPGLCRGPRTTHSALSQTHKHTAQNYFQLVSSKQFVKQGVKVEHLEGRI